MTPDETQQLAAVIAEAIKASSVHRPIIDISHVILGVFVSFMAFVIRGMFASFKSNADAQLKINNDLYQKYNAAQSDLSFLQGEHNALTGTANPHRRKSDPCRKN